MFEFTLAGMSVNIGIRSFLNMKGIMLFANVLGTALDVAEVINRPCRSNFFWLVLGILDPTDVARTAKLVGRGAKAIDAIQAMVRQLDSGKKALAVQHINPNSNITVLGHYRGPGENYTKYADRIKASYFYVKKEIFDSWQTHDQLGANFRFLDEIAAKGDEVRVTVGQHYRKKSWLAMEIDYLTEHKGYRWVDEYTLKHFP